MMEESCKRGQAAAHDAHTQFDGPDENYLDGLTLGRYTNVQMSAGNKISELCARFVR